MESRKTLLLVYCSGIYSVISDIKCEYGHISYDVINLIWRLYLYLLEQCQIGSTSSLRINHIIQQSHHNRRQLLQSFQKSQSDIQARQHHLQAIATDLHRRAQHVNQQCRQLMERRHHAQIRYKSEHSVAQRLQSEIEELAADLVLYQCRAADAARLHESLRHQIADEHDRIAAMRAEIAEIQLQQSTSQNQTDVEQMSLRVRALTADLNNLVAHDTIAKTMIGNAQRALAQFQSQIGPLRASTVRLGAAIQAGHWAAQRAARRLQGTSATLAVATTAGRQLKSEDDRWMRAIVQAEVVLDQYGADLSQYTDRIRDLIEGQTRTCALIEERRDVPRQLQEVVQRAQRDDHDLRQRLRDCRRKRRRVRRDLNRVQDQYDTERADLDRIQKELCDMRDVTIPMETMELQRLETNLDEAKHDLEGSTTELVTKMGRWRTQTEQQLMLIEDYRSRRELMIAQKQKSAASRDRYLFMIEQETQSIQHWIDRGQQLDNEIDRGRGVIRREKDLQAGIVARDVERQRQRTEMLSRLTRAGAELSRAQEQIDEVQQQVHIVHRQGQEKIAELERDRAAAHADLQQAQSQYDVQVLGHQVQRHRALERVQLQRDHEEIASETMRQRREAQHDELVNRTAAIRQIEFVHRKLRHELDQYAAMLVGERRAIQAAIEERLMAGRKTKQMQDDVFRRRLSHDHNVGEIGRQTLSLHLRSNAAVQGAIALRRLRATIQDQVHRGRPVEFALGLYLGRERNRAVTSTDATQTMISLANVEIQTDDVY